MNATQQDIKKILQHTDLDKNNIRSRLKALKKYGRQKYIGTYVRCGYKTDGSYGYDYYDTITFAPTLLLKNITCDGIEVTNHLWLDYTDNFSHLGQLQPGDKICFTAKVGEYEKGYYLHRTSDYQLHTCHNGQLIQSKSKPLPLPNNSELLVGFAMVRNVDFYLDYNRPFVPQFVADFDKWSQKHTPHHLKAVAHAEQLANNYNPEPYYNGEDDSNISEINETEDNDEKHSKLIKLGTKQRYTFVGTYKDADYTKFKNHYTPNLTIDNIYYHNQKVSNGLTFNYIKSFKKLGELHAGDKVQFQARVKANVKHAGLVSETHYYKLAYPTHAKLLKKSDTEARIPFPLDKTKQDIIVGYAMQNDADKDYVPFRVNLWRIWKMNWKLKNITKKYQKVGQLLIDLYKEKAFGSHIKDTSINFQTDADSDDAVPDICEILKYNMPTMCNRLGIKVIEPRVYDLVNYKIMTWKDLYDRTQTLLQNHYAQFKIKNPVNCKLKHLSFLHNLNINNYLNKIVEPIIHRNYAVYIYLYYIRRNTIEPIRKMLKAFKRDISILNKKDNNNYYHSSNSNQNKIRKIRLGYMYYIRLKRDTKTQYSKIKLSQQSLRNIKKVITKKYHLLKLTPRKQMLDFRKALKYVDFPVIKKQGDKNE